jgi:hypothetical protein
LGYSISGQGIDYGGQGGPQVRSQGGGAAMMSFHRPGAYAINFGLGTDNQLRTGGWSRGGNYVVLDSGNYNSYAPTLTGGNASGTWSINITGNAGYASSAGNADTVDGYHASNFLGFNGNSYYQASNWIQFNTTNGLYWPSYNGAHLYANDGSYGSIKILGSRNGWHGIEFGNLVNLMANTNEVGFHNNNYGWQFRWYQGQLYAHRGTYGGGTSYTVLDEGNAPYAWNMNQYVRTSDNVDFSIVRANGGAGFAGIRMSANGAMYSNSTIYAEGNIIAYYSDERLKTRTGAIENPIEKIKQLNGFYYVNNDLAKSFGYKEEKVQIGLSAQEVQKILPEVVTLAAFDTTVDEETGIKNSKSGEDYLTLDYAKLVPLLVEAIKEQQKQIDELKAKLG